MNELESNIAEWVSNVEKNGRHCSTIIVETFINKGYPYKDVEEALNNLVARGVLIDRAGMIDFVWNDFDDSVEGYEEAIRNVLGNTNPLDYAKLMKETFGQTPVKQHDPVHYPKHYNQGKFSVADFIADQNLSFDRGSCVKYLCRAGVKEDPELTVEQKAIQDLEKAIWYLNHEIEWIKKNGLSR